MPSIPPTFAEDVINRPAQAQLEAFIAEHRAALRSCLDGLTEEQARRSLVPSGTTLLGLVKHATFVERVWFDEAITCRSRAQIGIPATSEESFILDDEDTIVAVQQAHRDACESSVATSLQEGATSGASIRRQLGVTARVGPGSSGRPRIPNWETSIRSWQ
jgi:hypothetical protein